MDFIEQVRKEAVEDAITIIDKELRRVEEEYGEILMDAFDWEKVENRILEDL